MKDISLNKLKNIGVEYKDLELARKEFLSILKDIKGELNVGIALMCSRSEVKYKISLTKESDWDIIAANAEFIFSEEITEV